MTKLLFKTDFSDLEIIGAPRPNAFQYVGTPFPMRQNINYTLGTVVPPEIIDDPSATGGKSFHMKVLDGQPTHARFEVNWYLKDLGIIDEFYIDVCMRLPDGYHLEAPWDNPTWWGWHEIMNPVDEWAANNPDEFKMHLGILETEVGHVLGLTLRTEQTRTVFYTGEVPFVPPVGWFHLKAYVKRHPTDGTVKIWVNDTLMFDISHVCTMIREDFYCDLAKLYGGDILPTKELWVDSIEIHDSMPMHECPAGYHYDPDLEACIPDCPEGYHYDPDLQACVRDAECTVDSDCPEGFICVDGVCVEKPPPPPCIMAFLLTLAGLSTVLPYLRQFRSQLPKKVTVSYYMVSDWLMSMLKRMPGVITKQC